MLPRWCKRSGNSLATTMFVAAHEKKGKKMFGLSKKEVLQNAIKNTCTNEIETYRAGLLQLTDGKNNELADADIEKVALDVRKDYFNTVFDSVVTSFRASAPIVATRIQLALSSPCMTGLPEEFNVEYLDKTGISAGCTFALCYFALTNKQLTYRDFSVCSALNHYQNRLMDKVLDELEQR